MTRSIVAIVVAEQDFGSKPELVECYHYGTDVIEKYGTFVVNWQNKRDPHWLGIGNDRRLLEEPLQRLYCLLEPRFRVDLFEHLFQSQRLLTFPEVGGKYWSPMRNH